MSYKIRGEKKPRQTKAKLDGQYKLGHNNAWAILREAVELGK